MGKYPGLVKFVECPERKDKKKKNKKAQGSDCQGPAGIGDATSTMNCLEGSGWVRTGVGMNSLLRQPKVAIVSGVKDRGGIYIRGGHPVVVMNESPIEFY